MKRVLFVCTANSARSQMAEALLRHMAGDQFEVFSAGTHPEAVDPRTLEALREFGLPTDQLVSKSVASLGDQHFDYVISLCDKAHLECKYWPGSGVVMAWDFPDPRASTGPQGLCAHPAGDQRTDPALCAGQRQGGELDREGGAAAGILQGAGG